MAAACPVATPAVAPAERVHPGPSRDGHRVAEPQRPVAGLLALRLAPWSVQQLILPFLLLLALLCLEGPEDLQVLVLFPA